jgi:protein-S-isoprenylcysteine O-methyltransferase Ste14
MDDSVFRLIAIAIVVISMPIGIYFRRRAAQSGEKIDRQQEGKILLPLRAISGLTIWASIFAFMINPQWMAWSSMPLPTWLRYVGAAMGVLTIPLLYWVFSNLGKNVTDTVVVRKEGFLVTSGPYRWVRHPLYSVTLFTMIGFTLLSANWFIGAMTLVMFSILAVRTTTEEAKLIERYGDEYRAYMQRTGRFVPRMLPAVSTPAPSNQG